MKDGLTVYQDPISLALEVYYQGYRLPVRVVSMGEANKHGEIEITISTVSDYPTTFTNNRPEEI